MKPSEMKKVHLDSFHIAGFGFWEGCEAFRDLHIGARLDLVREDDNAFDPYAVAICLGQKKLGFVPRGHNRDLSKYLDMGYGRMYELRITRITPDVPPENQVEVILYLVNHNQCRRN